MKYGINNTSQMTPISKTNLIYPRTTLKRGLGSGTLGGVTAIRKRPGTKKEIAFAMKGARKVPVVWSSHLPHVKNEKRASHRRTDKKAVQRGKPYVLYVGVPFNDTISIALSF